MVRPAPARTSPSARRTCTSAALADDYPLRLAGTLVESTYRGTVLDYVVALPDGQQLVATTTRHVPVSPGSAVTVGFSPDAVIPLED